MGVDRIGPGLYSVEGFGISSVEPWGSDDRELVN